MYTGRHEPLAVFRRLNRSTKQETYSRCAPQGDEIMLTTEELAAIPLFSALQGSDLKDLGRGSADIHLRAGDYVVHEDDELIGLDLPIGAERHDDVDLPRLERLILQADVEKSDALELKAAVRAL